MGSFQEGQPLINVVRQVALTKISPVLQGMFFQGESLGVSPVERCMNCKLRISESRMCSSETAILTAQEEGEYNILKDHMIFDHVSGHLTAKYPFKQDPKVLVDNSKEALACQVSQERRQLWNGTHEQYVLQFQDMLNRGVVEEITPQEISQYSGPVNHITQTWISLYSGEVSLQ